MKQVGGVWLPDHETHLVEWMTKKNQVVDGKLTYQLDKQLFAYGLCKQKRVALDVGGHCGLWAQNMAREFKIIHSFEPVALHRQCFMANFPNLHWNSDGAADCAHEVFQGFGDDFPNVFLHACALGDRTGAVSMHTADTSSGDTTVAGEGDVPLCRLDEIMQDAGAVDLLKLDCEGYELFALRGGEQLIRRCMPVICVEQKPGKAQAFGLGETDAVEYLKGLGYRVAREWSGDYFMVPA